MSLSLYFSLFVHSCSFRNSPVNVWAIGDKLLKFFAIPCNRIMTKIGSWLFCQFDYYHSLIPTDKGLGPYHFFPLIRIFASFSNPLVRTQRTDSSEKSELGLHEDALTNNVEMTLTISSPVIRVVANLCI